MTDENNSDSEIDHEMVVSPEGKIENDIPTERDPRLSRKFRHELFGVVPVEVLSANDNITAITNLRDEIIDSIETEYSSKEGMSFGFDKKMQSVLDSINEVDPEMVSSLSDLPPHIRNTGIVKTLRREFRGELGEGIEQVQNYMSEDDIHFTPEVPITKEDGGKLLEFFAIVSGVIEQRSAILLLETLVAEPYRDNEDVEHFISQNLNQHTREDLLHMCNIIDGDTKRDLIDVRTKRNNLVHDPHERYYIDPDKMVDVIETAHDCAVYLDSILIELLNERYVDADDEVEVKSELKQVREKIMRKYI